MILTLVSAGCSYWKLAHPLTDGGTAGEPTLVAIESDVFMPRCAVGSCHGSPTFAAKLDLSSPNSSCAALVGAASCLFTTRRLIVPGHPEQSYLYAKLVGDDLGTQPDGPCAGLTNGHPPVRMPYGAAKLPDAQIEQVRRWIAGGAACDGSSDGGSDNSDGGSAIVDMGTSVAVAPAALSAPDHGVVAGARALVTVTLAAPAPDSGQVVALAADDASVLAVPGSTWVAAGKRSATFWVEGLRPARATRLSAQAGGATVETELAVGGLALAEVLYSVSGGDDNMQWVKLSNVGSVAIDLSRYSLGAGKSSYLQTTAALSGPLPPGSCFVVGGPTSMPANGSPTYAQKLPFKPTLAHGSADSAGGVALFDVAAPTADTLPLDTVVYGGHNRSLVRPDGSVATPDAAEVTVGHSLARGPNGWAEATMLTPNACNP
jgi:hypothetical protein